MLNLLKQIPNVNSLILSLSKEYHLDNQSLLKECINQVLDNTRQAIKNEELSFIDLESIEQEILSIYNLENNYKFKKVINGTGVILHTNLGRSILSKKQLENIEVLQSYNNLEFDIQTSKRGSRYDIVEETINKVCSSEACLVVNNNAAAVMLVLNEFASNKEVIVSNSELVEIGGSFRIPEIIKLSNAKLVNVGTTNKTKLSDYVNAINEDTGLIAKIHQSNFYIEGFVESVDVTELVAFKQQNNIDIPIYEDLATGSIFDLSKYGLEKEPTVSQRMNEGIDIVSFSADKLLGSVQAGIIVGKKKYIDRLKKNQLLRVVRPSSIILNIIETTFKSYTSESQAKLNIPTFNALTQDEKIAQAKADYIFDRLIDYNGIYVASVDSLVGGGCMPKSKLPSYALVFDHKVEQLKNYLATCEIPIVTSIYQHKLVLNTKVIDEDDLDYIIDVLNKYLEGND